MRLSATLLLLAPVVLEAQGPIGKTTARTIRETGQADLTGIAEPASGRFLVYAQDSGIHIVHRASGKVYDIAVAVTHNDNSNVGLSRSGNMLAFVRPDDGNKGPFVWTQALDSMTGEPRGAPRRVSIVKSRVAQPSSDGRYIAFVADDGNHNLVMGGTRLLVIPSAGGTERILDSAGHGLGQPRWSPDDKWIYYERRPALMRVRADGGKPDSIGTTGRFIDLSPNGQLLAFYGGPQLWNQMPPSAINIARTDGTIVGRIFEDVWVTSPQVWGADNISLLARGGIEPVSLKKVSLATGQRTDLAFLKSLGTDVSSEDTFSASPDGKQFGLLVREAPKHFAVFQTTTGARRDYAIPSTSSGDWSWSPNGRMIAFFATSFDDSGAPSLEIHVLDLANGRERPIGKMGTQSRFVWSSKSDAILFVLRPPGSETPQQCALRRPAARAETRRDGVASRPNPASIHRISLDGRETVVRELDGGSACSFFRILDDDLVARVSRPKALDLISLRTGATTRVYSDSLDLRGNTASISLSPDKRSVVFTVNVPDNKYQLAVATVDGKTHRLLGSPTCDAAIRYWISGGREIFAQEWDCARDHGAHAIVPLDGSAPRRVDLPYWPWPQPANDGQTVIVAEWGTPRNSIVRLDLSSVLRPQGSP